MAQKFDIVAVTATCPPDEDGVPIMFEHAPSALPEPLNYPVIADRTAFQGVSATGWALDQRDGTHTQEIELESEFIASIYERIAARWTMLLEHYEVDDSPAGWKALAIRLANDHVPGVRVATMRQSEATYTQNMRTIALVKKVSEILLKRRSSRSRKASSVLESEALNALFERWPRDLGPKPSDMRALRTQFTRAKAQYQYLRVTMVPYERPLEHLGLNYRGGKKGM